MAPDDSIELDIKKMAIHAIKNHIEKIDWGDGVRLSFHAEDVPIGTGRADLLLIDRDRSVLYVVEIVASEAGAEDVGRILSHFGWLKGMLVPASVQAKPINFPSADPVPCVIPSVTDIKGIMLAESFSGSAICALAVCPDLCGKTFQFTIELNHT